MMVFTFPTIMVKMVMIAEVSLVFSVEAVMIVVIIYLIPVVSMP